MTRATTRTPRWPSCAPPWPRCWSREQPFLAVCLGHQALCHNLGIPLFYKDIVFQGTQSPVAIDGRTERVGFYNTFVGRAGSGDRAARRRTRRCGPRVRRHQPPGRTALPGHPVPRRVDPQPARLRRAAPPGRRSSCSSDASGRRGGRPPRLLHVEPGAPDRLRDRCPADRGAARRGVGRGRAGHSHVVLSPGPGHPAVEPDFAVGREVLLAGTRPVLGVCLGMQGLVTAYGGTRRPGRAGPRRRCR